MENAFKKKRMVWEYVRDSSGKYLDKSKSCYNTIHEFKSLSL